MRARGEWGLVLGVLTVVAFFLFGRNWLADLSNFSWNLTVFLWLFAVMMVLSFSVVRHADALACILGEPYGTLILTLSVISIEVIMVSAVMLAGAENPTLGRDMMFSVLMIVLNGLVGISLLLGGWRHIEQQYNLQGANSFLAVLLPLAVVSLVLPNYTKSTPDASLTLGQTIFVSLMTLGLYVVFLGMQTTRHRNYFRAPESGAPTADDDHGHANIVVRTVPFHAVLLIACMLPVVYLSKKLAILVDHGIAVTGLPVALGGFLIAILVLTPEGLAAFQSALANQLQRAVNIGLGSALATIGLTVPAVLLIGMITGHKVILGLGAVETVLLLLTLAVSWLNFASGRSNLMQGLIHLILFVAYVVLIFD